MKRQAYGYRDQKFFELKILAMHEKNYAFVERAIKILGNTDVLASSYMPPRRLEWSEDLIWCPSQLEANVTSADGKQYILYLRWNHDDPWEFGVWHNSQYILIKDIPTRWRN